MAILNDWLDDRVQEIVGTPGLHHQKSDFRDQAKHLVDKGKAEGFSVAEIKEACGGDVERFLMEHQNAMTDVEAQQVTLARL